MTTNREQRARDVLHHAIAERDTTGASQTRVVREGRCDVGAAIDAMLAFSDAERSAQSEPGDGAVTQADVVRDIAEMMSEFVTNWPPHKKVSTSLALIAKTMRAALDPPKHRYWGAGEADCPRDIKAPNGELHTLRCKVCGLDNPKDDRCSVAAPTPPQQSAPASDVLREQIARIVIGPRNPVPKGSRFTLREAQDARWKLLTEQERQEAYWIADSIVAAIHTPDKAAGAPYLVEGSIYDTMRAAISLDGVTIAHFSDYRTAVETADLLNAALTTSAPQRDELVEALRSADAFGVSPNGRGGSKITLDFENVEAAHRAFAVLSDAHNSALSQPSPSQGEEGRP